MTRKPRSERFRPLQRLADRKEEAAAKQLGLARRRLAEAEQRLLELRRFREEYCRQLQASGEQGIDGRRLRAFQQFLTQLDTAIGQQQGVIARCRDECDQRSREWQGCHREQRIMAKTVERFRQTERHESRRREQKIEDEQITARHPRRKR